MIWKILEIEKTKDEDKITAAYRTKLRYVNPEDDEEGFKELRRAYEEALEYVNEPEDSLHNSEESEYGYGKKNEIDEWLAGIDAIYQDVAKRRDESLWDAILHDQVCDDLDMELEASEKLLVYFMSHSYMPQSIWQLVDQRFHYQENFDQLKEKFPENYLDYVMWQIKRPNFIDFDLFDGQTDSHVDDYIGTLYDEKNAFEEGDMAAVERLIKELKRFDVTHPYTGVEEARYLLRRAELKKENNGSEADQKEPIQEDKNWKEDVKEALSIMEELDFEYSGNPYIERVYGEALLANEEIDKAKVVYENLLEVNPENYSAALGNARCVFMAGNPEDAKEMVEDILEERVQDVECMQLLNEINEILVADYENVIFKNGQAGENTEDLGDAQPDKTGVGSKEDRELYFKLGWCYYQQKEFEKGIQLLDNVEKGEDYDYVNLRCRLYLANEDYEEAYPLTKQWLKMIEEVEDDGSKEMQKRKNRLSLAHFSIGVCIWELGFKEKEAILDKKNKVEQVNGSASKLAKLEEQMEQAAEYIKKAIEEEHNTLVKLSYMEQLARFYLAQKKYEECIGICNEIIEKDSGFYPAYVHRQKANYELKNAKEVIDDYFVCKEIYPGYSVPYVLAAEVFLAFEQYDDVESVIKDGKEAGLESDGLELFEIKCLHYKNFSAENVRKAIDRLEQLMERIRKESEDSDIEDLTDLDREMAILYWDLDMPNKALEIVDECLEKYPDSSGILQLKVDILAREKMHEEALETCRRLIETDPKNLHYRLKLGNCYERLENTDKAIECYQMILMENERFVPAVRRLMYVYSYLSNEQRDLSLCKKGIEYATRLIELTGNAEGYVERGNLYIDLYELEKAVEDCKEAIKLDPEAYYAYNNLGCALLKLRRIDEAIEPLLKVIAMEPDKDHLPYLNLAECYVIKKEYKKAIHAYEEVLRIRPKALSMRDEIAKIWIKMGEYPKAIEYYKKLIREYQKKIGILKDGFAVKMFMRMEYQQQDCEKLLKYYTALADVYRQMGDYANAEKWYINTEKVYYKLRETCDTTHIEEVAEFYRDTGKIEEAERVLSKLTKHLKKNGLSRYHIYFTWTTVMFEKKDKERTKKYADTFIKNFVEQHGGYDTILSDGRYRPMYAYDLAIMHICAGRLDEAKKYLEQIKESHVCVTCETCGCFEYYFAMGMIAELEGHREDAKRHYEKAIEIKGDYPCAKHHLEKL